MGSCPTRCPLFPASGKQGEVWKSKERVEEESERWKKVRMQEEGKEWKKRVKVEREV